MKKLNLLFTLFALIAIVSSCKSLKENKMTNLENINWKLIKLNNKDYVVNKFQPEGISISFQEGNFSTSDGCNANGGEYKTENDNIEFGKVRSTMRFCDEETMKYSYSVPFHLVKKFKIVKNKLFLYEADGKTVIAEYEKNN